MIVLVIIAIILSLFFIWKGRYISRLRKIRDEFDLTTPEGKMLIRAYNRKIDTLNGKRIFT